MPVPDASSASLAGGGTASAADGAAGGTSSRSSGDRAPVSQGLGAGRDVKFLSVFVVGGGIQMPPAAAANTSTASTATNTTQ